MTQIREYLQREPTVKDRDEIIEYAYNEAVDGMFPLVCTDNDYLRLYLYEVNLLGSRVALQYKNHVIFSFHLENNSLRIDNKSLFSYIHMDIDITEEELFQASLVSNDYVSHETIQQVRYLVKYCLDNSD